MRFSSKSLIKPALSVVSVALILALVLSRTFYLHSMIAVFMAVAIAGILPMHLSVRPLRDLLPVTLVAGALVAIQCRVLGIPPHFASSACIVGLSSGLVVAFHAIWTNDLHERRTMLYVLVPSFLLSFSDWTAATTLAWSEALHPKALDLFLYKFDCSLGFEPSFLVGQWFHRWHWLHAVCLAIYVALPVPLGLVYGQKLKTKGKTAISVFWAFLVAGPIGVVFFNILPAMGPIHVFPGFPHYPLTIDQARRLALDPVLLPGARNAIPSLHMVWVLLAWWNARDLSRWIRGVAIVFVMGTALATLGLGEHYLIDLIVACPFALMIHATFLTTAPLQLRKTSAFAGVGATLAWFAMLSFDNRFFWTARAVPWLAVIATVAGASWLVYKLGTAQPEMAIEPSVNDAPMVLATVGQE